jgi:hypothetical protein
MSRTKHLPMLLAFTTIAVWVIPARAQVVGASDTTRYAVATLAPARVTVPPIVLQEGRLHAMLVELATGADRATIGQRLGIDRDELDRLYALVEVEGLGRQAEGGGWTPLALALDTDGAERLTQLAADLAVGLTDTLAAHWTLLDTLVTALPVAGRLPLAQTGFVLVGGYILGLYQADAFWQAGLAPAHRPYAFRVYRMPAEDAPAGHLVSEFGFGGWRLDRFGAATRPFGLLLLRDSSDPLTRSLLGADTGDEDRLAGELFDAYRTWYVLDRAPDPPTRRLLQRLEAVDKAGRLRIPMISLDDVAAMRAIADRIGALLWPQLQAALPDIAVMAGELGYDDPEMLGEVALWTWERAAQLAVRKLVERGMLLPPISNRGQALLLPIRR